MFTSTHYYNLYKMSELIIDTGIQKNVVFLLHQKVLLWSY